MERKGLGHPDTLADLVAITASNMYSRSCLNRFGVVPPHWLDKIVLAGAKSNVAFGASNVILPIKAYQFGKTTRSIGGSQIDSLQIFQEAVQTVFQSVFPNTSILENVVYETVVHDGYGPDHPPGFYNPGTANEVQTLLTGLRANDTSVVTAYAGYSDMEKLTIEIENFLNSTEFKSSYPATGTDIKVMTVRDSRQVTLIICIPFIGSATPNFAYYADNLAAIRQAILEKASSLYSEYAYVLFMNTKDSGERTYLTVFGTALDKGDCGAVGRGNRYNGIITPQREMSIEAAAGKNPTHHVGKLYSEVAFRMARDIHIKFGAENVVNIISHNGDDLRSPSHVFVKCSNDCGGLEKDIREMVRSHLDNLPSMVMELILSNPVWDHANKPRQMYRV
ncbi:MAG: hypothetical protein HYY10_03455 [Candidatus Liptonbacteria bacterium]|nr:hypothetical protein [Candidatus Liptonbacteria bacterium]